MQKTSKNATLATVAGLILKSPMFLLVSMILSFVIMFGVQMFYYADFIFLDRVPSPFNWIIGCAIGLMTQLARLAFGIAGASDFAKGKTGKGLIGVLFSLGLAIVGAYEVAEIALAWSNGNTDFYNSCLLIMELIVWLGFLLEIRIAISVGGELKEETSDTNQADNSEYVILENKNGSSNGIARKKSNGVT